MAKQRMRPVININKLGGRDVSLRNTSKLWRLFEDLGYPRDWAQDLRRKFEHLVEIKALAPAPATLYKYSFFFIEMSLADVMQSANC